MTVKLKAITVLIALVLCVSLISGAFALYSTDGTLDITFAGEVSEPALRTVYFYDAYSWHTSGTVYAYAWDDSTYNDAYPGVEMTAVDGYSGWYSIDIDNKYTSVVFNSNDDSKKTADLTIDENNLYFNGISWVSGFEQTIYFYNVSGWTTVSAYAWESNTGSVNAEFPGEQMTAVEGHSGWYSYKLSTSYNCIIFNNNNNGKQTGDLLIDYSKGYYNGYEWTDGYNTYSSEKRIVYFKNTSGWTTVYAYAWNSSGDNGWPGEKMTQYNGQWYKIELSIDYNMIIFNNNSGTQTGDLSIDGIYYDNEKSKWIG